ncbi:flavin monoamine oxidase family protein [Robiginitalea sp.]|uniref:flavin monoamine oxidase family protein n=1 Tax=Robiginitalea sp. TaxID=1902411 RepID=UPI003C53D929
MKRCDILIIGGGLTGLMVKHLLRKTTFKSILIEGRERLGGRIYSTPSDAQNPPIEMGATWWGPKHTRLKALLKTLDIPVFPQQLGEQAIYEPISTSPFQLVTLPEEDQPSFRIGGGTSTLIRTLAATLPTAEIHLKTRATGIAERADGLRVECPEGDYHARLVISTLPPYLLAKTVNITPPLPTNLSELMEQTHTWMGESIKFGLVYDRPFWREARTSGTVFSNVGPVTEMYDHSDFEDNHFALKGFISSSFYTLSETERRTRVLRQLRGYYGDVVDTYRTYREKVWTRDPLTYAPYDKPVFPHQNNGNSHYQKTWLGGKLLIAGSETASLFPGYMEGAVQSAKWVAEFIEKTNNII